jgi:hypothetical protein
MNPVMAVLGVLGLSALLRKRPIPHPVGRPRADGNARITLMPPLLLLVGLLGLAAARAASGPRPGR